MTQSRNELKKHSVVVVVNKAHHHGYRIHCVPAVDHCGSRSRSPVDVVSDRPDELDEGLRGLWDSVIGPHGVVKLTHQAGEAQLFLLINTQVHED